MRWKFIVLNAYIEDEKSQINNLNSHLKNLDKKEQNKPKTSRRKEIMKIEVEINETKGRKAIQKINKTKSCFFEKINGTDKPLTILTKKQREDINDQYQE